MILKVREYESAATGEIKPEGIIDIIQNLKDSSPAHHTIEAVRQMRYNHIPMVRYDIRYGASGFDPATRVYMFVIEESGPKIVKFEFPVRRYRHYDYEQGKIEAVMKSVQVKVSAELAS